MLCLMLYFFNGELRADRTPDHLIKNLKASSPNSKLSTLKILLQLLVINVGIPPLRNPKPTKVVVRDMSNNKEAEADASLATTNPMFSTRADPEATGNSNEVPEDGAFKIMLQGVRKQTLLGKRVPVGTSKNTRMSNILVVTVRSGP